MRLPAPHKFPSLPKSALKPPPGFKKPQVKAFRADMERLGEEIAENFKEQIIENIEDNRYGYSLAPSTIVKKGSDTPLIDTHQLVDAIYRDGTTVSVENTPREDSELTNLEIAIIQEYGVKDKHIPARPIWRDTFREFKKTAKDKISDFLDNPKFKEQ